jgi:hypothetical protein
MLERLIRAGLNIARLNFSHGDFTGHAERIARSARLKRRPGGVWRSWPTCRDRRCVSERLIRSRSSCSLATDSP